MRFSVLDVSLQDVEYFIQKMIDSYGNDFLTSLAEGTPDSIILDNDIIIKDVKQFEHNLCGNFTCSLYL